MVCPSCKVEMEQRKYEGVTVDRCSQCEGVWLDYGELRLIATIRERKFTEEELDAAMKADSRRTEESPVLCPKCDRPMEKRESYDTVVDMCPQRHGIWLDKGELERIQIRWEQQGKRRSERAGIMAQVVRFLVAVG